MIRLALAGVGIFTLLMVFAVQRSPAPADAAEEDRFDEAWIDIMRPLALKTADIEHTASTEPKPVVTERIIPSAPDGAPTSMPPVLAVVDDDDKPSPASRHRRQPRDICSRHNMRKVAIRSGKSWRCRK